MGSKYLALLPPLNEKLLNTFHLSGVPGNVVGRIRIEDIAQYATRARFPR